MDQKNSPSSLLILNKYFLLQLLTKSSFKKFILFVAAKCQRNHKLLKMSQQISFRVIRKTFILYIFQANQQYFCRKLDTEKASQGENMSGKRS